MSLLGSLVRVAWALPGRIALGGLVARAWAVPDSPSAVAGWGGAAGRALRRDRHGRPVHVLLVPVVALQLVLAVILAGLVAAARAGADDPMTSTPVQVTSRPNNGGPARGLAAWVDMYDWSATYSGGRPALGPDAVDAMAAKGIQVLEIQAAGSRGGAADVLEPALLQQWIDRAHARGIQVIAWYLPTLVDPVADIRRLTAIGRLRVDGVGIDIESIDVANPAVRSERLVQVTQAVRAAVSQPLQAILMPPVLLDRLNPRFWPGFPWAQLAPLYDVWTPMSYWTERRPGSPHRDAYNYSRANVEALRQNLGRPDAVVTLAGGEGATSTLADVAGLRRAAVDTGTVGVGMYDYRSTLPAAWAVLRER